MLRQIVSMPVPIELLRAVLLLLALFFGYMLGRSAAGVYKGTLRKSKMYGWLIRLLLTILAISWRSGPDTVLILLVVLGGLAVAGGAWVEMRPRKPEEDLTKQIFPE